MGSYNFFSRGNLFDFSLLDEISIGTQGDDIMEGSDGNDFMLAGAGDDTINSGSGNDLVFAGRGNDTIVHNYGVNIEATDFYFGGSGDDTLELNFTQQEFADLAAQNNITTSELTATLYNQFSATNYYVDLYDFGLDIRTYKIESLVINIEIPPNTAPIAVDDTFDATNPSDPLTTNEDVKLTISAAVLLGNDSDTDNDPLTILSITPTANTNGAVILNGNIIEFTPTSNYNGTATFSYTMGDGRGGEASAMVTLMIVAMNDAPTNITLVQQSIDENVTGAVIGTLSTDDVDTGDTHTYTVDDTRFKVVGNQLQLQNNTSINFEAEPTVNLMITSTDSGSAEFSNSFIITINDVNEAPTDINFTPAVPQISENATIGAFIATATTLDPDAGDSHTYSLVNNAGKPFAIDPNSGDVTLTGALDFETAQNHMITVRSTDSGGLIRDEDFTIGVGDEVEVVPLIDAVILDNTGMAVNAYSNFDGVEFADVNQIFSSTTMTFNDIKIADLDNQNGADVFLIGDSGSVILWNDGNGGFGSPDFVSASSITGSQFDVGDMNGDGMNDVVALTNSNQISVWFNAGGGFGSNADVVVNTDNVSDVTVADFSGDGLLDIFALESNSGGSNDKSTIWVNDNTNNFTSFVVTGITGSQISSGTLFGNSNVESDISIISDNNLDLYENVGIDFFINQQISVSGDITDMILHDINNDGADDAVVLSSITLMEAHLNLNQNNGQLDETSTEINPMGIGLDFGELGM